MTWAIYLQLAMAKGSLRCDTSLMEKVEGICFHFHGHLQLASPDKVCSYEEASHLCFKQRQPLSSPLPRQSKGHR